MISRTGHLYLAILCFYAEIGAAQCGWSGRPYRGFFEINHVLRATTSLLYHQNAASSTMAPLPAYTGTDSIPILTTPIESAPADDNATANGSSTTNTSPQIPELPQLTAEEHEIWMNPETNRSFALGADRFHTWFLYALAHADELHYPDRWDRTNQPDECPPQPNELQPFLRCHNCGGHSQAFTQTPLRGHSRCKGIAEENYKWKDCICYAIKSPPGHPAPKDRDRRRELSKQRREETKRRRQESQNRTPSSSNAEVNT